MPRSVLITGATIHFVQPLKARIVAETGRGLTAEGSSAAALVKASKAGVR